MSMKPTTPFSAFESLDIRVGRVVDVAPAATSKPTYRLTVDFGPTLGRRVSCGAYKNYPADALLGALVVAVLNFGPKRMGPEVSEVLILGVQNEKKETIYLRPESDVPLGTVVF